MSRTETPRPDSLSVPEMLRIMDVATALRQGRELVDEQLNATQLKERLRERMLAAAKVTGEDVTPEEVDVAIRQYYASLHTFREPAMSVRVALAQLWVSRFEILRACTALAAGVLICWLFFSPVATFFSGPARAHRQVAKLADEVARRSTIVRSITRDPKVGPELDRLAAEADALKIRDDAKGLAALRDSVAAMEEKLGEAYSVVAVPQDTVSGRNKNTVVRYPPDSKGKTIKAYYLFVQAKGFDGKPIPRRIRSVEDASEEVVATWAEQVPEAVYDRLARDKREDGVLNETAFAVKRKGELDEEVTMPGADGKPLARMGRITKW